MSDIADKVEKVAFIVIIVCLTVFVVCVSAFFVCVLFDGIRSILADGVESLESLGGQV